jgi:multicomponent Na+:H+ antiporter subunit D
MSATIALPLAFWTPLAGALLIALNGRRPALRESLTLFTATLLFASVACLAPAVFDGARPALMIAEPLPGLALQLTVEPLGLLFALLASLLWIVTSVYSIAYMRARQETNLTRFYTCFALSLWATMGMALAGNLLTLFVFYEVLTLSTYPLVTHSGTEQARRSGRFYLGLLLAPSLGFLLFALIWTWQLAGTLDFVDGGSLRGTASPALLSILFALYAFGIGKAALMPLHRWLPAAMVAPTPVSALLHAVAVVKGGVFFILKVTLYVFGIDLVAELQATQWLLYVAAATILLASLVALRKDNLKARLAYSTISQLGYIVLGAFLATTSSVIGSTLHMVMHAFGKITLFFCAGAILVATQKTAVSQMHGVGRRMPFTMSAFLIGSLSIIGLPPAGGVWSKWFLMLGTLEAGQQALLAVLMASSLLSALYLLTVPLRGFFYPPPADMAGEGIREAPPACLLAIGITALGCVGLFFYADTLYAFAQLLTPGGSHG